MSRWTAWSARCRWSATPSTSCSAPTCATSNCCAAGWRNSRGCQTEFLLRCPREAFTSLRNRRSGGVRLGAGRGLGRRLGGTAGERKLSAVIQRANAVLVEAGLLHLQIGAIQRIGRQFLDRKPYRFGRGVEAAVGETGAFLLADRGGEQFGAGLVAECGHGR